MKTIATVGPVGHIPRVPGTAGSLVGLLVAWILSGSSIHQLAGCLVAIGLALWSAGPTAKKIGSSDPPQIVIDEVAGMMVALVALPVSFKVYVAGFLLFRFFDVVKPFPIRKAQELPGSLGIVLDDLLAGLFSHLVLRLFF